MKMYFGCLQTNAMSLATVVYAIGVVGPLFAAATALAESSPEKNKETSEARRVAHDSFDYSPGELQAADGGQGWRGAWMPSRLRPAIIVDAKFRREDTQRETDSHRPGVLIQGTGDRSNPLRRELLEPFRGRELFVRFQFRYDANKADASHGDPEFFVLWLDRLEGGDRSTHAANVPNIGVHVADRGPKKGKNVFMVRIGPARTAWSKIELKRNQTFRIIGRLAKTADGDRADFDRFDLWVDPRPEDLNTPAATVVGSQSINLVRWVGFSTGRKTEVTDRIYVDDLVLSRSWNEILDPIDGRPVASSSSKAGVRPKVVWDQPIDFARHVYPLLKSRCFTCHSGANPDSGYRLDVRDEILGYSTGEVLAVPGKSHASRLIELVASESPDERMPPSGKGEPATAQEVALLRAWIDQGLKWDDQLLPPPTRNSDHWAFQQVQRPKVPTVSRTKWVSTPVDAFIAARHTAKGLTASPEASRHVLLRRLFLDLIGLPPTPKEIEEFVIDSSPQAYERLVERLLASQHYGERWGRCWLDLARWAESHGYQHDLPRPYAWRYRDYVIDSFNSDKPYDQFLKEQIAGDELQPYSDENLIATGFLASARISGNQMDKAIQRNDVLVDVVNATASIVLGLTLECAQCHNHKFDPLSQRDYYRLQSFFINGQLSNLSLRQHDTPNPTDLSQWIPKETLDFYMREAKKLEKKRLFKRTKQPHTWGFYSPATGDREVERLPVVNRDPIPWRPEILKQRKSRLLIRGNVANPGAEVGRGWPEVLGPTPSSLGDSPRTALAEWMAERSNPLVARVWVNRIWQYHFGRGLVSTPSDFGTHGARPSHPELLDWLAEELMENAWSTKHIHRQIVMSSTYRQHRRHHAANAAIDPDNTLLWCWPRRRLEAEAIRDSVLVATGELIRHVGGPSIPPTREEDELRRTIYLFQRRSEMPSVMEMFDAPDGIASCSHRGVSTVALQPLYMLNSQFMTRRAEALASKVHSIAGDDPEQTIEVAFVRTLGRRPEPAELKMSLEILSGASAQETDGENRRLTQLCHALLNLNEFIYIP